MLKKFRYLTLVMTLILVVVSSTTFAAKKPIKIVFGTCFTADHFFAKGDRYFKKLVEKKSKGQLLIDYYPANQLGTVSEQVDAVRSNAQQIYLVGMDVLGVYWPKIRTFFLPYLMANDAQQIKIAHKLTSIIDEEELAKKSGIRILNTRIRAPRHLTTKFPVHKIEDIKGLKIRIGENSLMIDLFKALGTVPTVISSADVYTGIATGTVDAQENPYDSIYTWKYYEVQKYVARTAHCRAFCGMLTSDIFWKKLTASQRKILTYAAAKSAKMGIKDCEKENKRYYKLLVEKGMKFTDPELAPFIKRSKTIWPKYGDPKLIKKIQAVIQGVK
jgi:tripartite ATP-independent transporter DctP family solute receptor